MSMAELKQAVQELSPDERLELAGYLRQLAKENDPAWRADIGRSIERSRRGGGHSVEELREAHDRLSAEGR